MQHAYGLVGAKFLRNHVHFRAVRENIEAISVTDPNVILDAAVGGIINQLNSRSFSQHISPDRIASQAQRFLSGPAESCRNIHGKSALQGCQVLHQP